MALQIFKHTSIQSSLVGKAFWYIEFLEKEKMKIRCITLSARNKDTLESERAVLPALIYTREDDEIHTSRMLSVGWWAWGIGLVFLTKK